MPLNGYRLSARAEAAERRYDASRKSEVVASFSPALVGRQDRDNIVTNRVTLQDASDAGSGPGNILGIAAVWACVNLLAGTIASLPLMVYRGTGAQRVPARDHPLYRLLHDRPNYDQTALDFLELMCGSIELAGNAYARKDRAGTRIVALTPIRPDIMTVRRLGDGGIGYRWSESGETFDLGQEDVLHIRGFGGGPLGGASTLSVCRSTFRTARSIEGSARQLFENGARPSGLLKVDQVLKPEQRKELEGLLQEKFVGAMNAGRPMVLDNKASWEQLTLSAADSGMIDSWNLSIEDIARIFGVPPHMIGHTAGNTKLGSSIADQTLGFQKFTLRRRLKRIEMALEQQLLTRADLAAGITIEFALEGLLRGDTTARADFYQKMTQIGAMTINEVRALENLPPVEGGDVPRMQAQNIPITQAGALTPAPTN